MRVRQSCRSFRRRHTGFMWSTSMATGVSGLDLAISVHTEGSDWIVAKHIEAAHVRTDADGTAIVPWVPRDKLQYVDVDPLGSDWKVDEIDLETDQRGDHHGSRPSRADRARPADHARGRRRRRDSGYGIWLWPGRSKETFRTPAHDETGHSHFGFLQSTDMCSASSISSGPAILGRASILGKDSAKAADDYDEGLSGDAARGTGDARVRERDPVVNAWVDLSDLGHVTWIDRAGKKQTGQCGARTWLTTDADGVARAAVGKGKHKLRLTSGDWNEEQQSR